VFFRQVLVFNDRKESSKSKSNLTQKYDGPYSVVDVAGKTARLKNNSGVVLKKKVSIDRLKTYKLHSRVAENKKKEEREKDTETSQLMLDAFISSEDLDFLVDFVRSLDITKPTISNLQRGLSSCPVHTFLADVSNWNLSPSLKLCTLYHFAMLYSYNRMENLYCKSMQVE